MLLLFTVPNVKVFFFLLVIILSLLSVLPKPVLAIVYFEDNFVTRDGNKWNFNTGDGLINFIDGYTELKSEGMMFPSMTSRVNDFFAHHDSVIFEAKFMFDDVSTMGNGIGIGFTNSNGYPFYQFALWNGYNHGPILVYNNFNIPFFNNCDLRYSTNDRYGVGVKNLSLTNGQWHVFSIEKSDTSYKVYIDKDTNVTPILITDSNQCKPEVLFIGNPLTGGSSSWTKLKVDYVRIFSGTYQEPKRNKIVVAPGLGASWNARAMIFNEEITSNQWKMTPFVKNYDRLVTALETNGLVRDIDFYVWNYDWRKPLNEIVEDMGNFLANLGIDEENKVDLVGHSLGGLVARIWASENKLSFGNVITLGSPHFGAVKAYETWNGVSIGDKFDAQSIALNVLLQLQKKNKNNLVETVRSYAPILKDIMPTFNFLRLNGVEQGGGNEYLSTKNNLVSDIFPNFLAIVGMGKETKEWVNLGPRNVFDRVLGIWENGRPESFVYGDGDGTVLVKSAKFSDDLYASLQSDHGVLPDNNVNFILTKLGLEKTTVQTVYTEIPKAVFYLGSPAEMGISCSGNDYIFDKDGWVVIDNELVENCRIKLLGVGGGMYHLVTGNTIDDQSWRYAEGSILDGEEKMFIIGETDYWYERITLSINELLKNYKSNHLLIMKKAAKKKNFNQLLNVYLQFRRESTETRITFDMAEDLMMILSLEGNVDGVELEDVRQKAIQTHNLVERKIGQWPNYRQALSFNQAERFYGRGDYPGYLMAAKIWGIILK